MKKKNYIPMGTPLLFYLILFIITATVSTLLLVFKGDALNTHAYILLGLLNLIMLYYFITPLIFYNVVIENETIKMKKDFGIFKEDRIQKEVSINIKDVKEYKVILTTRDSEGNEYSGKVQKKKYIEFTLNDDTQKRIYVSNLSNKQIISILDTVKGITNIDVKTE